MSSNYTIYALIDPRDDTIFYIGRTGRKPSTRLKEHIEEEGCTPKNQTIDDVIKNSFLEPSIVVLEDGIASEKRAFTREVFWIEFFSSVGAKLTNASIDYDGKYFLADYWESTIIKKRWTTNLDDFEKKHVDIQDYKSEEKKVSKDNKANETKYNIVNKIPIYHGKPWTSEDQELLKKLNKQGKSIPEIAMIIGRSVNSTKIHLASCFKSQYGLKDSESKPSNEDDDYDTNLGDEQMLAHKSGTRWTKFDDESLIYMLEEGETIPYIAKALGRSEGGVRSRIFRIRDEI